MNKDQKIESDSCIYVKNDARNIYESHCPDCDFVGPPTKEIYHYADGTEYFLYTCSQCGGYDTEST